MGREYKLKLQQQGQLKLHLEEVVLAKHESNKILKLIFLIILSNAPHKSYELDKGALLARTCHNTLSVFSC